MARMNYIQRMVQQYGENWIVALNPEDIQRSGKRFIFKEMVKGQINYEVQGKYFLDAKLLDNLIISCRNELEINTLYYNAVNMYRNYYPATPNIVVQENHLASLCYIYNIIMEKLQMVKNTSNIGYLADTSALLYAYRNHLE